MSTRVLVLSKNDRHHKLEDLGARIVAWAGELEDVEVHASHDRDILSSTEMVRYDVCVLCITMEDLSDGQEQGIVDFVAGGKVAFGVHSASVTDEDRETYIDLIGGRFTHHSPYHEFEVHVVGGDEILNGVADFSISDELYVLDRAPRDAKVLATALWEEKEQPLVYTKPYGKGMVLYNAFGHNAVTWDNPSFQKLVIQGLSWTVEARA